MPTHVYRGHRKPPTAFDHLLAHCWEIPLSVWAMVGGGMSIYAAFTTGTSVSRSYDQLPMIFAALAGALLVLGGGGIVHGLFSNGEDLRIGFTRERMGLALAGAGWAIYGVCIYSLDDGAFLSWSLCFTIFTSCVLRIVATYIQERLHRAQITEADAS
jgi:hypothetical protein